jgi:cell division protein FtsL
MYPAVLLTAISLVSAKAKLYHVQVGVDNASVCAQGNGNA